MKDNKGFTLIEVLVAIVLIFLLVTAYTGAFITGLQTETRMNERLEAMHNINSKIEQIRNMEDVTVDDLQNIADEYEEVEDNLYLIKFEVDLENAGTYSAETLVSVND